MTSNDKDKDWLDALAGKPKPDADSEETRRATALRQAIQRHNASLNPSEFDAEAGLQKLKFKLRSEGLSGEKKRTLFNNHFIQFAMAASVVLSVGLMMRNYLPQELPQNEAEIMRGLEGWQIVLAPDPEARLKKISAEIDQLGIKYQIERKEGKILLKIHGVDPAKENIASFLERNHITPPVEMDVLLDIRPLAKP